MKKLVSLTIALTLLFSLASCGQPEPADTTETTAAETTASSAKKEHTTNKQGFIHFSHGFSDGWKTDKDRSTDVCLCATYAESESSEVDFVLSASLYDDGGGAGKAESLAHSVKQREASSGEVEEKVIDGITFYSVCFDSYEHDGKRLCNMFAQTEPYDDGTYYFLEISLDNMSSDSLLQKIDNDLKTIQFTF